MNTQPQPLVQLSGITKEYTLGQSKVRALRGVDLTIDRGEFSVILGPSGSGKSTLLNIVGCLDRATSGTYILDGENISHKEFDALAETRNLKISFIFQSFNLIPVLNVYENVEFPCLLRKKKEPVRQLRERVEALCADVGLAPFLKHRPDELSGGQRQRVAIARALVTQPSLVLADEPTANLDSTTSAQILDLMGALNNQHHITFLFATHDPRVMERARRTSRIEDGVIVPS